MKMRDLENMDKEKILGLLGLETKTSDTQRWMKSIGTFGVGLLVGAGVGLLLAPTSGSELREGIRIRAGGDAKGKNGHATLDQDGSPVREG